MGSFNWKNAAKTGLAYYLSEQQRKGEEERQQKRAYERAGDEMVLQSFLKLGTPLPPEMVKKYPMLQQLSGMNIPEMEQQRSLKQLEEEEKIKQKYAAPDKPSEFENQMGMYFGIDPSIIKMLPPEEKSKAFKEFAKFKATMSQDPNAQALLNATRQQQLMLGDQQFSINDLNAQIKNLNLKKTEQEMKDKQQQATKLIGAVDDIMKDWGAVPKEYKGYVNGVLTENGIQGINDPNVKRFITKKKALTLKVAKMLEGSRMSDQDRAFYLDLVMNLRTDNPEAMKANAEGLKWLFGTLGSGSDVSEGDRPPTPTFQVDPTQMSDEELINAVNSIKANQGK